MFNLRPHHRTHLLAIAFVSLATADRSSYGQDLTYDPTFDQGAGLDYPVFGPSVVVVQQDAAGRILAGGSFLTYNGVSRSGLVRLLSDGTLDAPFCSGSGASSAVLAVGFQSDGRVIIGGRIDTFDGQPCFSLSRLNLDGTLDTTFSSGVTWDVSALAVLPNDEIVACGRASNTSTRFVKRFSANGALDVAFDPTVNGDPWEVQVQADGKILLGGSFSTVNGVGRSQLVRLDPNGSVDPSFVPPAVYMEFQVRGIAVQPDGRILVGVPYSATAVGVSRLLSDGSLDPSFQTHSTQLGIIEDVDLLPNGQVFICGAFTDFNGAPASNVALFNSDGSLATSTAWGPSDYVGSAAFDGQGRFVAGGFFVDCAGAQAKALCRLRPCATGTVFLDADGDGWGNGQFPVCGAQPGYVANPSDCDDSAPLVGAPVVWYLDSDEDGYGDPSISVTSCSDQPGFVPNNADCDDSDPMIYVQAPCDDGDPSTVSDQIRANCVCAGGAIDIAARVFLEGPYTGSSMNDNLRAGGYIPLNEPYSALGFFPGVPGGGETIDPSVLATTGPNAIVDWIMLALRDPLPPHDRKSVRMALLQRDGDVVDLNGTSPVRFSRNPGPHMLEARHRNHLGIMTSFVIPQVPTGFVFPVDLTLASTPCYGFAARKAIGGTTVLWAGNTTNNGFLSYTGTGNDRDPILLKVGPTTPNGVVSGYHVQDVNMDGLVKYVGAGNDRDPVLVNIGGSTPNNSRSEQLP